MGASFCLWFCDGNKLLENAVELVLVRVVAQGRQPLRELYGIWIVV